MGKLSEYLTSWNLVLEAPPLETSHALIAYVQWKQKHCVLKVFSPQEDERTASVLQHYAGEGAVRLLKQRKSGFLVERCLPGTPLTTLVSEGKDEIATRNLCTLIALLHKKKRFSGQYPSIHEMNKSFTASLGSRESQYHRPLIQEAYSLYTKLSTSQSSPCLLHGDLHHNNVLYDKTRGWLAIDPKGYVGEPCYEVGALLRNPYEDKALLSGPEPLRHRVDLICGSLGFERERVIAWGFSQAVLAALWHLEDGVDPTWFLEVALTFKQIFQEELCVFQHHI